MSIWALGSADVTEETQAFKDKLSSKDSQIAAQETQLYKQALEFEELKLSLNEALHKLNFETQRALQLENELNQRSEDLREEKIAVQNTQAALVVADGKVKAKDLEMRELQATLESLSYTSDEHQARCANLGREKKSLEMRVRELEANIRQLDIPPVTPRQLISRPRSSSLSNFRITSLEQDLRDARISFSQKESELLCANQKLSQVQNELMRVDNEKRAMEKNMSGQLKQLQGSLEEKEEELALLREQQGDGGREEELLKRIDEDDAKITALEAMLRGVQDFMPLKELLRDTELQLKKERHKVEESLEREITLIQEKEDALNDLDDVRRKLLRVEQLLSGSDNNDWKDQAIPSYDTNDGTSGIHSSPFLETSLSNPSADQSALVPQPNYDEATVIYVERLLCAVDRLRGERDDLRRDIQFLESESRFTIEALEAKLSASVSSVCDESVTTIAQMKAEMDDLYAQLSEMNQRQFAALGRKNEEMKRLALAATSSLLIVAHLSSCNDHLQGRLDEARTVATNSEQGLIHAGEACFEGKTRFKELENKFHAVVLCLEAMTRQRDDLQAELETKDRAWKEEFGAVELAQQERSDKLEEVVCQLTDFTQQLEDVESERDSLTLQVTNLMTDLATAQQELANAESRYSSLQFHQLSTMTSNEANRALRDQIEELEMRVMRRTEQIGVHQHDIRRLETNLRLQEERLAEMTMELEMLAAQKDAMVEDCADAREARDRALSQGEALEEEMENMEVRLQEEEDSVRLLIGVVFETVSKARQTILRAETRDRDFEDDQRQLTIALAVSQVEQAGVADYIEQIRHENAQLNMWATNLEDQLRIKDGAVSSLSSDLNLAIQDSSRFASEFAVRSSELEAEICRLQTIISTQEKGHQAALSDLHNHHEDVQKRMQEGESPNNNGDSSSQQQANEIVALQSRLADANMALTELRSIKRSSGSNDQKAILEATNGRSQHETQIEATQDKPLAIPEREEGFKEHYEEICSSLRIELEQMARKATDLQEIQLKLQLENERVCAQLTLVQQENIAAAVQAQDRLSLTLTQLEAQKAQLQEQLEEATYQLEKSTQQTAQLSQQLRDDRDKTNLDREQYSAQMLVVTERQQKADAELLRAHEDLEILNEKLAQAEMHCRSVEDEKLVFLEQITTMKAEIQRLLSLTRFLENQVKESEQARKSLSGTLERTRSELERTEKSGNTAMVNHTLQSAQHKREMADLKRELTMLQSRPNLEHVVAELEDHNNEMEELLRSKCAEIEENDDRSLEMLKENKKLHARVESLTRKVQNLQTKLSSLKATAPSPSTGPSQVSTEVTRPPARRATTLSSPQIPNPTSRAASTLSSRVVSGPSSLPRPKTPERRIAPTPVFKTRTPERILIPTAEPLASTTMIGKKRRAPDDFESCETLPPQAFTADSTPGAGIENKSPRVRRVLSRFQSGFTPLRHQPNRPIIPAPSPKRSDKATSHFPLVISDLTNNPRDLLLPNATQAAKPTKRSWLGKIRGVSTPELPEFR